MALATVGLPVSWALAQLADETGRVVRQCGRERWAQKILADDDTAMINFTRAGLTSIGNLRQLPRVVADEFMPRQPYERNIYSVDALLCGYALDNDGNFRLYLRDPSGAYSMPALIPDPNCPEIAATPRAEMYRAVREWIRASVGSPTDSVASPVLVAVTGVGLYEVLNHEKWMATNRLALHPVIGLQPIDAPRLVERPTIASSAAAGTKGTKQKKGKKSSGKETAATAAQQSPTTNGPPAQSVAQSTEQKKSYRRTGKRKKGKKFRRYRRGVSGKRNG
ncbi:MAG: hypothetical protein DYG96_07335 [Chlorobi bacterium CHB2]|nr:hypothetical protein [Chlorobi bacterium CHB2]